MILVLLAVTPAMVLAVAHHLNERARALAMAQAGTLELAEKIAGAMDDNLLLGGNTLFNLCATNAVNSLDPKACAALFARLRAKSPDVYANIFAMTPRGRVFAQAENYLAEVDFSGRDWFQRAVKGRDFVNSGLITSMVTGKRVMVIACPLRGTDGALRAVLAATMNLGWISQGLGEVEPPPGGVAMVVDYQGMVLAQTPQDSPLAGKLAPQGRLDNPPQPPWGGAHDHIQGLLLGHARLIRDMPDSPVALVAVPAEQIYGPIKRELFSQLAWLAVVGLIGVGLSWAFGTMMLIRPMAALAKAVENLGRGDLAERLPEGEAISELDSLAGSFNRMAESLQTRDRELEQSRETYQALIENALSVMYLVDPVSCAIVDANPSAAAFYGYSREDMRGMPVTRLNANSAEECLASGPANDTNDRPARPTRRHHRMADGTERLMEVSTSPLTLHGRPVLFSIAVDITEREQLRHQLEQGQKMEAIGELAAGIAHEINTPVQFVGSNLDFLSSSMPGLLAAVRSCQTLAKAVLDGGDPTVQAQATLEALDEAGLDYLSEEVPKALAESREGIDRVGAIVLSIKKFAHPGTEEKKLCDLNAAVENTVLVARNEWKYVAEVQTDLAPDLPPVPCAPGELNQVILNILVNAAHAVGDKVKDSGEKGLITLATRVVDGMVELCVADTGTGIPEAVRGKIFDPFFTTKEVGKGTGQGLAIAFAAVKKQGGFLDFTTEPGQGTTFRVRLALDPSGLETGA
jgi:PAS domain S-box-containing protein